MVERNFTTHHPMKNLSHYIHTYPDRTRSLLEIESGHRIYYFSYNQNKTERIWLW